MFVSRYKKPDIMIKGIGYKVDLINDVSGFEFERNSY